MIGQTALIQERGGGSSDIVFQESQTLRVKVLIRGFIIKKRIFVF